MKRKGQEEIVGFVLIMLLVVVILLIMLGISIRKQDTGIVKESKEIFQFIESLMKYTTACEISPGNYLSVSGLILECHSNSQRECLSEENVCSLLNRTIADILDSSWKVGPDRPYKGYSFVIKYTGGAAEEQILTMNKGACVGAIKGTDYVGVETTTIFEICS